MRLAKTPSLLLGFRFATAALAIVFALVPTSTTSGAAQAAGQKVADDAIGCLGRIEPGDGVRRLGARSLGGQPSIVGKLLVAERDQVRTGQVVAELDSAEQLRAVALLAESRVEVARVRLRQVEAGAKPSDVAAQRAEIDRIDVEMENARKELHRQEELLKGSSAAEAAVDQARLRVDTLTKLRLQATERLASLSETRPVDVDVAKAELQAGIREVARARAEYNVSLIRSPLNGRVIKIHTWPGEEVGPSGVMEVADTGRMYVLADVSENDMARVRPGQRAKISGHGLPMTLTGTVETVGLQVTQNSVLKLDPAAFTDARVVETKIRLDEGNRVAHLIHLRVNVRIEPAASTPGRPDGR